MVRAKFYVYSKMETTDVWIVTLQAVTKSSPENETFWKYTPSGKIEMSIRKEAGNLFEVGKEYYVDFTPVAVEEPAQ